jgi:hypothetical protein
MNVSIVRSRTRGFPQMEGEDYDDCFVPVNQTYLDMSHYIVHNIHGLEFTSNECKDCSPR